MLSTVHLIKLERLIYVADVDDVLLEVSEKLYELPYQPTTLSSKFVGPDATHKRLLFIQEQQEKIRKQAELLERNDRLIQEQRSSLVQKQQELEAVDKLIQEQQASLVHKHQELEAADKLKQGILSQHERIEQLVQIMSLKKRKIVEGEA